MTVGRWSALLCGSMTVIAVLAIAGARGPAPDASESAGAFGAPLSASAAAEHGVRVQASTLGSRARNTAEQLLTMRLRDSLLPSLAPLRGEDASHVGIRRDDRVHAWYAALLRARIDSQWQLRARTVPGIRVIAVAITDTASSVEGLSRPYAFGRSDRYLLPPLTDGHTCVVIHRARLAGWKFPGTGDSANLALMRKLWSDTAVSPQLGPCGFVGAFGMPGPHIRAWLDTLDWEPARLLVAQREAPDELVSRAATAAARRHGVEAWLHDEQMLFSNHVAYAAMSACAQRNGPLCSDMVLRQASGARRREPIAGLVLFRTHFDGFDLGGPKLRYPHSHLLADVLAQVGPDRFMTFWTSTKPLDDALRDLTGTSADEWALDYVASQYGTAITVAPRWPLRGLAGAALFVVFALGGSIRYLARGEPA